jgi:glycosyltransferase involved in cell wall biosynthesis
VAVPDSKQRIVYLIPDMDIGGPQRIILDLARKIDHTKFEVHIISLMNKNFLLENTGYEKYCTVTFCNAPVQTRFSWLSLSSAHLLYWKIKEIKPQIIHSHLWGLTCIYLLAVYPFIRKFHIKYFHTIHSSGGYFVNRRIGDLIRLNMELFCQKITGSTTILISKEIEENAKQKFKLRKTACIRNGIDTDIYHKKTGLDRSDYGFSKSDSIIIFPARGQESKGHYIAIKMLSLLIDSFPDLKLLFVGEGVKELIEDQVIEFGLSKQVVFMGGRNDIPELLSISDYGIFPSYYEGMPIALGEMMSCSLPIVASDIPSIRELSQNGTGCLLARKGSPDDFVSKFILLIQSDNIRNDLAHSAREVIINNFQLSKNIELHENIYLIS